MLIEFSIQYFRYPIIQSRVKRKWKDEWLAIGTNKLIILKSSVDVWPSSCDRDRKVSCILTRLRIGYTRLTHQHLMENKPPPYCTDCLVPLTVRHFLAECPSFADVWHRIFPQTIGQDVDQTLQLMLSENLGEIYDPRWLDWLIASCDNSLPDVLWLSCARRDIARSEAPRTTSLITYLLT